MTIKWNANDLERNWKFTKKPRYDLLFQGTCKRSNGIFSNNKTGVIILVSISKEDVFNINFNA